MEAFYEWLRNIVICLFLISLIYQLFPDSDYKKYMRVAAGLILIVVVMTPVLKIFGADIKLSYFLNLETLKTEIETLAYPEEMYAAEQGRLQYVTENYKKQLENEVTALFLNGPIVLKNVSVEIDGDVDSKNFGKVLSVSATAFVNDEKRDSGTVAPVVIGAAEGGSFVPAEYVGDIADMQEKIAYYLCTDVSAVTISMD